MVGLHEDVLKVLPRLSNTSISKMARDLGDPSLLWTALKKLRGRDSSIRDPRAEAVTEFLLRTYTFDLSFRFEGMNSLIGAVKTDMAKVVRLILEQREDLLNCQDDKGRTPLSWAATKSKDSIQVLLGYKDIQSELRDRDDLAPIDYLLERLRPISSEDAPDKLWEMLPVMIQSLEHGLNRLDRDGRSLLHAMIDNGCVEKSYNLTWDRDGEHWKSPLLYEARKPLERVKEPGLEGESVSLIFNRLIHVPTFRRAIGDMPVSTAEIRFTPCKCGLGTIFLAMSTGYVELVEALLEFYPDLVNDICFDESSPLEWASCIEDEKLRQSMIDFVHSKNPVFKTYRTGTPVSDISESDPGEAQKDYSFTDVGLQQRQGGHAGDEADDG